MTKKVTHCSKCNRKAVAAYYDPTLQKEMPFCDMHYKINKHKNNILARDVLNHMNVSGLVPKWR